MSVDEMSVDDMYVDEISVDNISVDIISTFLFLNHPSLFLKNLRKTKLPPPPPLQKKKESKLNKRTLGVNLLPILWV